MKKMLKMAVMAAAMFVAVSTGAKAQGGGGGGGRGRGPNLTTVLKDSLKVSDAILAKADSIQKAYNDKNAALSTAARGGDADARTKLMESRQAMNADIKKLLTADQVTKFDAIMSAGRRGGN